MYTANKTENDNIALRRAVLPHDDIMSRAVIAYGDFKGGYRITSSEERNIAACGTA